MSGILKIYAGNSLVSLSESIQLPTVNVGSDLTATDGDSLLLSNATASNYDSLNWTCTSGQNPTFSDAATLNPTVTFNETGLHTLRLTASNTDGAEFDELTVTVSDVVNQPPTANAGPDQSVAAGATITFDFSGSVAGDNPISSYSLVQTDGDSVTINSDNPVAPTAVAPLSDTQQTLSFSLTVTDENGLTDTDTIDIIVAAQVDSVLNIIDKLNFTIDTDGEITAYPGRANRETFRFTPSDTTGLVLEDGYFDFSSNSVDKIEISVVESTGVKLISSETEAIVIDGSRIHCRLGDLEIRSTSRTYDLTFSVFVEGDTRGVVMVAPNLGGNISVRHYQTTVRSL
jgi:PKD repeat protein